MNGKAITRRCFLGKVAGCALGAVVWSAISASVVQCCFAEQQVPYSAGRQGTKLVIPANATDCHHHIYDSRYPLAAGAVLTPPDATVSDYRLLQKRLVITRHVIVQPSTYGVDNRLLLESLKAFGLDTVRGIAVVNTAVTDEQLHNLDAAGVRGIRFNLSIDNGVTDMDMILPLAYRVHELGWHVQVVAKAEQILAGKEVWDKLPCTIVFDHLAHIPHVNHPAFALVIAMLRQQKCLVKLSGAYILSESGAPSYADRYAVAKGYVDAAPEQVVWGSDWPHPTVADGQKPDDAILLDLLADWAPEVTVQGKILVDNPARLYGF